jgi:hypothetical protein
MAAAYQQASLGSRYGRRRVQPPLRLARAWHASELNMAQCITEWDEPNLIAMGIFPEAQLLAAHIAAVGGGFGPPGRGIAGGHSGIRGNMAGPGRTGGHSLTLSGSNDPWQRQCEERYRPGGTERRSWVTAHAQLHKYTPNLKVCPRRKWLSWASIHSRRRRCRARRVGNAQDFRSRQEEIGHR